MQLLRILFLALAGVWLLQALVRLYRSLTSPKRDPELAERRAGGQVTKGTLHKDPVCGTFVSEDVAVKSEISGRREYFCSVECRDKYRAGGRASGA